MRELSWIEAVRLYRCILRRHRQCLPWELRVLGDRYAATEFRQMRAFRERSSPDNFKLFYSEFLGQWRAYLDSVASTELVSENGDTDVWQQLSVVQREQLERLRAAALTPSEESATAIDDLGGALRPKPPE